MCYILYRVKKYEIVDREGAGTMENGNADKDTVMSVLSGNSDAYGDIVHRYKDILFKTIHAMIKNYHTAEDLTQDTFIDGYMNLKSLGEPYNVGAWLMKIAKNKCLNYLARSKSRHEGELDELMPDLMNSPEDLFIAQQDRRALERALQNLPDLQKTVTVLYYFENRPQNKIAELLKIPVGTVKRRLHDARLKLKKELENMDIDISNREKTVSEDFEKQVAEKVKALQGYFCKHNHSPAASDGFEEELKETISLIDKMPESKEKHAKYADAYHSAVMSFPHIYNKKDYMAKGLKEAELGEKAQVMVDILSREINQNQRHDENMAKIEDAMAKIKNMPQNEDTECALWQLHYYRGNVYLFTKNIDKAKADYAKSADMVCEKCPIRASAVSTLKRIEVDEKELGCSFPVGGFDGSGVHFFKDGQFPHRQQENLMCFCSRSDFINLFEFVTHKFDADFFGDDANIGKETVLGASGIAMTLMSKKEKIAVLAGEFDDCIHIRLKGASRFQSGPYVEPETIAYDINAYYAKNVGIVKIVLGIEKELDKNYELREYKISSGNNAGLEYIPFTTGNIWKYTDTNLPPIYWSSFEREIVGIHVDELGNTVVIVAQNNFLRMKKIKTFDGRCDSDTYIKLANAEKNYESIVRYLKYAIQKNSSAKASLFSLSAIDYIERCAKNAEKRYWFPLSGIESRIITVNKTEDKISYKPLQGLYSLYPHSLKSWDLSGDEKKFMGVRPFGGLISIAGTIFSEKWVAGYSEQKQVPEINALIWLDSDGNIIPGKMVGFAAKAEDGGTVSVRAGTFENCLKVTFDWKPDDIGDYRDKLKKDFDCVWPYGTKIYYFAPNVGIVKHESIWDESLSLSCELAEYRSSATNGEYMPVYIGNRWVYEETTLDPNMYRAKIKYDIVAGTENENEFFMIDEKNFIACFE